MALSKNVNTDTNISLVAAISLPLCFYSASILQCLPDSSLTVRHKPDSSALRVGTSLISKLPVKASLHSEAESTINFPDPIIFITLFIHSASFISNQLGSFISLHESDVFIET